MVKHCSLVLHPMGLVLDMVLQDERPYYTTLPYTSLCSLPYTPPAGRYIQPYRVQVCKSINYLIHTPVFTLGWWAQQLGIGVLQL